MTPSDFKSSAAGDTPPADLTPPLEALWWAAKGDWDKAHKIVMDEESADAAWVHAICTASKAICRTRAIGTRRRNASPRTGRSMRNGRRSQPRCL